MISAQLTIRRNRGTTGNFSRWEKRGYEDQMATTFVGTHSLLPINRRNPTREEGFSRLDRTNIEYTPQPGDEHVYPRKSVRGMASICPPIRAPELLSPKYRTVGI
jgi:hypothetical protein